MHIEIVLRSCARCTELCSLPCFFRWISAQLMSNHVAPEAVELITAAAYCPDSVHEAPGKTSVTLLSCERLGSETVCQLDV